MALYIGAQVRDLGGGTAPLIVTSTVRDETYQRLLVRRNREATRNYSLHTTGWAFDVERRYGSGSQARAFQFVLDRLQVLGAIAWVREPDAIHVTVARDARSAPPAARPATNRAGDRRHPHARRAARGAARLPVAAALPPGGRPPLRPRRRGRRAARRVLARGADLELPVAQGGAARAGRRPPRRSCPTCRASGARTSRWIRTGTPTTATWRWRAACSRTSTCAGRRS